MNKIKKAWIGLGVVIALTACKKESQVITGPVVLVLNAVNSSDEEPVEGCYPQLTIYIRPGRTVAAE